MTHGFCRCAVPLTMRRRTALLACVAWSAASLPRLAQALDAPSGDVVLTVSGRVQVPNRGADALFDLPMLQRLKQVDIVTKTPWYSTVRKFSGPLVRDVLSAAGARGDKLMAGALNDYRVDIPIDDVMRYDVVLATLLDDKPMQVRDKGPLFIMYPFDRRPELRNAVYYSRCAWQVNRLEVP